MLPPSLKIKKKPHPLFLNAHSFWTPKTVVYIISARDFDKFSIFLVSFTAIFEFYRLFFYLNKQIRARQN